ncbi:MAG: GNAT family N-acetyltransferase [Candidatus Hydrogenedentes bacterium]|nr:GNAT family N-acetyltransferase [Candidatus Hydrogenedentota bacterium]
MRGPRLHRFEAAGRRFALDPETCFCFECDEISWDVLEHYPHESFNRIQHLLGGRYPAEGIAEVIGEIEWLRSAKSILKAPKQEELEKHFEVEQGLKRLSVELPDAPQASAGGWRLIRQADGIPPALHRFLDDALMLLVGRAGAQPNLHLELRCAAGAAAMPGLGAWVASALRRAGLTGKKLRITLRRTGLALKGDATLDGHRLDAVLEATDSATAEDDVSAFLSARTDSLGRVLKAVEKGTSTNGRIILIPWHAAFAEAVEVLDKAGFGNIQIDLDAAYVAHPQLDPQAVLEGMSAAATYYANRLLHHHYFRLDPFAELFWRIYNGSPLRRADAAGVNELAMDAHGRLYPSALFLGVPQFVAGELGAGQIDESTLKTFEDLGATTTAPCIACWARYYCGGGRAAVHHSLSGSHRQPAAAWCDAERAYVQAAIGAFNVLSSAGVNFTRVYRNLDRSAKPSFLTLAKAAFTMSIGIRPIDEADAEWLTRWENWNEAAYFACSERSTLLATRYDREMDSLHPRSDEQELVLVRKDGSPLGLLKLRPDKLPGTARAAVYFRKEADYADGGIRRSFRGVLQQASSQAAFQHLLVSAGPGEQGLMAFLEAVGFQPVGTEREALYLHGAYHDVRVYALRLAG